jgi:eukaryotic-like serine/threonine-protein kinase
MASSFVIGDTTLPLGKSCRVCLQEFTSSHVVCPNDGTPLQKQVQPNFIEPALRLNRRCRACGQTFNSTFSVCPNDNSPLEPMLQPGARLVGGYVYESTLGRGGMGVVYRARHQIIDRLVAIKMLIAGRMSDAEMQRFQREGKAASRLSHPNIINILEFGVTDDGSPYMVMEYVEGISLAKLIQSGNLELPQAVDIALQICSAMQHAHSQGVLHRDLKPTNIMLRKSDDGKWQVRIVDFGIAKIVENDIEFTLTQTGEIFGSPTYMSPEQGQGKKTDRRTDVYSFGVILYEMLTGTAPFQAESPVEMIVKHVTEAPPPLVESSLGKRFPPSLEQVVTKALEKNPETRFQSFEELSQAFQECFEGRYGLPEGSSKKNVGILLSPRFIVAVSVGLLAVCSFLAITFFLNSDEQPSQSKPDSEFQSLKNAIEQRSHKLKLPVQRSVNHDRDLPLPDDASLTPEAALTAMLDAAVNHYHGKADLRSNRMTPEGLSRLSKYKRLRFVTFGSGVGDQVFDGIEDLPLTFLGLENSHITNKGFARLAHMQTLVDLNLTNTSGKGGRLSPDSLKSLTMLTGLRSLRLAANDVRSDDVKLLVPLQHLTALDLSENPSLDDSCLRYLNQLPKLDTIFLKNDRRITPIALSKLKFMPQLLMLSLAGNPNVHDLDLLQIASVAPLLQTLWIPNTDITDDGLRYLALAKNLSELSLTGCPHITEHGIKTLRRKLPNCAVISDYN